MWRRVEVPALPPSAALRPLSACRGLAGAWGSLSAPASFTYTRPAKGHSRKSPDSQSGRLAQAELLARAVFPEQGGGTQCIVGQGGVTFRLLLGLPPQPHVQTF